MNERSTQAAMVARIDLARVEDFALGRLELRPSLREIACDGRRECIDRRVMQVLVVLARAQGRVVSRDDLIDSCWAGVIVGEDAVNNCISRLRKVAEVNGNAFAIETIPRVGYRLKIGEACTAAESHSAPATPAAPAPPTPISASTKPPPTARTKWIAAVSVTLILLALIATGFAWWNYWAKAPRISAPPAEASVAVLPFVNMSGDPKKDYFSDGFSEELVNDLSNNGRLRVAARTSSFAFKGKNENIETIARALGVHAIVEGSVRESADRVRITAQLVDGNTGYHLWSATYDRNLTDILSVQDELARAITSALTHRLAPAAAVPHPKMDPAVYRLYLDGIRQFYASQSPGQSRAALATFKQVTARAPDFADGFAWLSRAAVDLASDSDSVPEPDFTTASDAAQRALSLDPGNTMARAARSIVEVETWDWRSSVADLRILRSQNPRSYFYLTPLWNYYLLSGFPEEALSTWRQIYAREPRTFSNGFVTIWALYYAGHFKEEIDVTRAALVIRPHDTFRLDYLCRAYAATGQIVAARKIATELRDLHADYDEYSHYQMCQMDTDLATGNREDALKLLQVWESNFPDRFAWASDIGCAYVLLGNFNRANDWFGRAYQRREYALFQNLYFSYNFEPFGYQKALAQYRLMPGYKALAEKSLLKEWQAEHDRIAAALAANRDPLE